MTHNGFARKQLRMLCLWTPICRHCVCDSCSVAHFTMERVKASISNELLAAIHLMASGVTNSTHFLNKDFRFKTDKACSI